MASYTPYGSTSYPYSSNGNGSDDSATDETYTPKASGPRIHTIQTQARARTNIASGVDGASDIRQFLGQQYGGDRDLYVALGYETDPTFEHFAARYARNGTARALIDKPPKDCWGDAPEIRDDVHESSDGDTTQFEEDVTEFLAGRHTRKSPIERLEAADRMARLGEYSLIVLGLSDPGVESGTPEDLENEVEEGDLSSPEDISYLSIFTQGDAPSDAIEFVEDPSDSRFSLPESYEIDFGHGSYITNHSRVLHVVEGGLTNDLYADSILLRSLNRLDDVEKLLGGGAEAFWRTAYQGLIVKPPTNLPSGVSPQDYGDDLSEQIRQYRHNMSREIYTSGEIETLSTNISDPSSHLQGEYAEIAAGHDIPQSILMGNETGERATSEDRQMYHEYIARRRRQHCENAMLRPLLDRLIEYGVLSPPEGEGYVVEWPALDELGTSEEADLQKTYADTVDVLSGGMPREIATIEELRMLMGWDAEIGSEADSVYEEPDPDAADDEDTDGEDDGVDLDEDTEEGDEDDDEGDEDGKDEARANQNQRRDRQHAYVDESDGTFRAAAEAMEQYSP